MMMQRFKNVSNIVMEVLQEVPETRSCDNMLYFKVCEKVNPMYTNFPFCQIMQNIQRYGFPSYKSVERARRKIQSKFPELAGSEEVEAMRALEEERYREYARKVNV
jgi:hypothetical protein